LGIKEFTQRINFPTDKLEKMKYLRFTFLLFAFFELLGAIRTFNSTPDSINARFGGEYITPESMHFVFLFGAAILSLAIASVFGFFTKDRTARIGLCLAFICYNAFAAYACYKGLIITETFRVGLTVHSVLLVLFMFTIGDLIKNKGT